MGKQKINPDGYGKPPAPYSNVIKMEKVRDMFFLSGVSATNENGDADHPVFPPERPYVCDPGE